MSTRAHAASLPLQLSVPTLPLARSPFPPVSLGHPRPVFIPVPDKPPVQSLFLPASTFLSSAISLPSAVKNDSRFYLPPPVDVSSDSLFGTSQKNFSSRPLTSLAFSARASCLPDGLLSFPSSLVVQIDGLLFATFRERLERDVCALSPQDSFCPFWGPSLSPASSFCGLYMPPPTLLGDVIDACRLERGLGVFIGRLDCLALSTLITDNLVLLRFDFPHTAVSEWCGVFCSFAFAGRVTRRKPHTGFDVDIISNNCVPSRIGLHPFCPARMSPTPFYPERVSDTSKASPRLAPFQGFARPVLTSPWSVSAINACTSSYPFLDVANLCTAAASSEGSVSLFAGDRDKCVLAKNSPLAPNEWEKIRQKFLSDVALNRMVGPFPRCPFPNDWCNAQARQISLSTRPKDKWDPLSERFRVISSLSVHKPASVNDLVFSPKLVSFHLQGSNLRDSLFHFGPRARFNTIDQVEAFRSNKVNLHDAHLYVYMVPHGLINEWYVDLAACFGSIISEWSYAVEVAVIKWSLQNDSSIVGPAFTSAALEGYVDNWFLIGSCVDSSFCAKWARVKERFSELGVDMHEEQLNSNGPINAIGWDWDTASGTFSCPPDKLKAACLLISEWSSRCLSEGAFSINEIEKLVGLQRWVSTACPIIVPSVAYLQAFGFSISKARGSAPLDCRAAEAVHFLNAFFTSWDGRCPISAGFSPVYCYEFLIRSDASTDDGCGGFCLPFTPSACGFLACYHAWDAYERADASGHSVTSVRESTMFFELLGLLHLLVHFVPFLHGRRVQFECDSEPAIRALIKGFSKKPLCMRLIRRFWLLCASSHITPRFVHILARYNAVADHLSHLRVPQAIAAALSEFHVGFSQPPYSLLSPPTRL